MTWDVATGHPSALSSPVARAALYAWSKDGAVEAVAEGANVQITNRDHVALPLRMGSDYGDITAVALKWAGDELAVATSSGYLVVWDDFHGKPAFMAHDSSSSGITCLTFNSNGGLLAVGGRALNVWETKHWKPLRPSMPAASWVTSIAFSPTNELAVGDFGGHLRIFSAGGDNSTNILAASGSITAIAYSLDGSLMASGGTDGAVKLWAPNGNAPIALLQEQSGIVSLSFHLGNDVLAVAGSGNEVSTWDIAAQRKLRTLPVGAAVAAITFAPKDTLLIGVRAVPTPRPATLHILVMVGGTGSKEDGMAARADAIAVAGALDKGGRGLFGRIDQRLLIDDGLDANRVRDTFQSISRDSQQDDSLFVYYVGVASPPSASHALTFADGGTVTLAQFAHWLDAVSASTQTIAMAAPGAVDQQDLLKSILAPSRQRKLLEQRKRFFIAFDREAPQQNPKEPSASAAMLAEGLSGQADQSSKDGRVTAAELQSFLYQRTLAVSASGSTLKGKFELESEGDDFVLVSQVTPDAATRGSTLASTPGAERPDLDFQKRHDYALLIATDDYDWWPKLTNPIQDAQAVADSLKDLYGFQVELLRNPTQKEIYDALTRYRNKQYDPGDQLLVFIAGHGDFDENAKEGFLVARDSQLLGADAMRTSLIPHSRLRNYIDNFPVRHVVVVMDVCFGGTFDRAIAGAGDRGAMYSNLSIEELFTQRDQYITRKFITSGGKVYVPDGEPGHHSPFVNNLLAELRNPARDRGYITFPDLLSAVGPTNPSPVWGTWGHDGAGSDFFLISHNAIAHHTASSTAQAGAMAAEAKTTAVAAPPDTFISQRKSVCFVGLKNLSGDLSAAVWGDAIAEQMTSELGAGQRLRIISSEDVGRLKRDLALEDLPSYSGDTLLKIRQNTGADLVIAGSFLATKDSGGLLHASFTIQDSATGQIVDSIRLSGTQAGVEEFISRASALLLSKLGVSDLTPEQLAEVKAGMPTTAQGLKYYSQAMVALRQGDAASARDLLLKTDAAEPGIAFVHRALTDAWQALGYDKKAAAEAKLAADLAVGLPRQDMLSIQARAYALGGHLEQAIDAYRALSMLYPDDLEYGLKLARTESDAGRGTDALTTLVDLANLPEPQGSDPRILIERARAYDALGAFPDEKKSAEQAQLGAAAKGAHLLEAEADVSLCWAEDNLGNDNGAVIACQQADEIYHRFADTLGVARAQNNLAHTLMDKSDFQGALAKYRMAAELTESIGARKDYAGALLNVAKMQSYLDQSADAEISLKQVMALAGEISDNDTLGKAYLALADLAHTNGEVARAQELVTAELKLAEGDADQDAIARAHSFLASYGLESGNLGAAITSADKCIELRSKAEMPGGVAYCQQTRGDILLAQNHLSEAQTAYQAAAQLYEKATQPGNAAAVWMAQAELNVETGRAADGETLARKAWIEFQKEQDTDMQASALSALLHALIAQQKTAEAAQSWSALEKLRPKDPDVQLETEIAEARYRSMSGNFDTALERTEQVRDSCTKRGRVDCELQARLLAGQVRLAAGRRDGLAADLQGLSGEASKLGFNLIAEEATRLLAGQATAHAP